MDLEISWDCDLCCSNLAGDIFGNRSICLIWIELLKAIKVWLLWALVMNLGEDSLKLGLEFFSDFISLFLGDITTTDERFGVENSSCSLSVDQFVHLWLCEAWFIALVMATAAITDHVNYDIFIKGLTVLKGNPGNSYASFRIIAIYMEDGSLNHLCNICCISRRACRFWRSSETNLVIDNYMNGSTGSISTKL